MLGVTKVTLQGDYTVYVEFNDGQSGVICFKAEKSRLKKRNTTTGGGCGDWE